MNTRLMLFAASAGLLLASAPAYAGPCSEQIRDLEKILSSKDAGMGPVSPGTEATPAMSDVLKGRAASPADVQRQNQGQPTAAESAQAGKGAQAPNLSDAMGSLQGARELDKAGKEAECMAMIQKAKAQAGSR